MKAVAIKGSKKLEIKEIDEPKQNGDVIIDVKKAGICGSDLHYFVGGEPIGLVMGHEFCGVVIDSGNRDDLKVGDRVSALPISPCMECEACETGNYQYCTKTWEHASGLSLDHSGALAPKMGIKPNMVVKIPDNVSYEEAAMIEPTAVGLHAINLADIKIDDKVLIVGGGIIGLVSAMFAKKSGASYVAVSETNEARGENSVKLGVADEWFDAKDEKFVENVKSKVNGGFDVVIECCGNAPAVGSALSVCKNGGTVVLVGVSMEPISVPTILAVMHELKVMGAIAYTKDEFEDVIDLMAKKQIDVTKFISDVVGLDGVQEAYERLTSGTDSAIKILVDPNK
ncbi:MAG: alcohol dehydrogenase catalytic domain-containing protein [Bacilli bacterium]|nr:alcohol dehydrogenase catalytic domain-containing protein [Bacilli bacterium]